MGCMLYFALFTAVGFSSFEASKALLGVGKKGGVVRVRRRSRWVNEEAKSERNEEEKYKKSLLLSLLPAHVC